MALQRIRNMSTRRPDARIIHAVETIDNHLTRKPLPPDITITPAIIWRDRHRTSLILSTDDAALTPYSQIFMKVSLNTRWKKCRIYVSYIAPDAIYSAGEAIEDYFRRIGFKTELLTAECIFINDPQN